MKKINWNNFWLGTVLGLLTPFISIIVYWQWSYRYQKFIPQFFNFLMEGRVLSAVISLCLIPSLGMFFLFINKENYKSCKGIIFATLLYGFLILYLKMKVEHSWSD